MKDFPLLQQLAQEPIAVCQPTLKVFRRPNDQIERKGRGNCPANANRLMQLICRGHNDEKIHVTVNVRNTVRVGAEENNPIGFELFNDLPRIAPDRRHGNVR
jgi:hypothetical protein